MCEAHEFSITSRKGGMVAIRPLYSKHDFHFLDWNSKFTRSNRNRCKKTPAVNVSPCCFRSTIRRWFRRGFIWKVNLSATSPDRAEFDLPVRWPRTRSWVDGSYSQILKTTAAYSASAITNPTRSRGCWNRCRKTADAARLTPIKHQNVSFRDSPLYFLKLSYSFIEMLFCCHCT